MKKNWFFVAILVFMLSSCATPFNGILVKEVTSTPTGIPVPTATPTLTPEPTFTPTQTATPQPTPTLMLTPTPVEWELVPYFEKVVEYEWEGVLIKARLIIDESMSSKIESIEISDELLAEVVAKWMFEVWNQRKGAVVWDNARPSEVREYMRMWARAQDSGLESDWRKVQVDDIWANDLTDGNGYIQSSYDVWPMYYEDDTPYGVTPLNIITLAFVSNDNFSNVTHILGNNMSLGTNLNDGELLIYRGFSYEWIQSKTNGVTVESMSLSNISSTGTWLAMNEGGVYKSDIFDSLILWNKVKAGVVITFR